MCALSPNVDAFLKSREGSPPLPSNRPAAPFFVTINITTACNLDCAYCFMQPRSNEIMTSADFERVVNEIQDLAPFFVVLSGGEPFLHPQASEFLRIAHGTFRNVFVLTNGSRIKAEHLRTIGSIIDQKGALAVQVSLDAVDPSVNALTRGEGHATLRSIQALSEMGVQVTVAIVVTRMNIDTIPSTIEQLSGYACSFHVMTLQAPRERPDVLQSLGTSPPEEQHLWVRLQSLAARQGLRINTPLAYAGYGGCARGGPCMAAFSHVVIDPSLRVRPCDRLVDAALGNLRDQRLADIWNGPSVLPFLQAASPYCRLEGRARN